MQPDIKTRILDARIACDKVMEFTKGLSYEPIIAVYPDQNVITFSNLYTINKAKRY